jgi:hypothetical protein
LQTEAREDAGEDARRRCTERDPAREVRSRGAFKDQKGAGDPLRFPEAHLRAGRF